MFSAIDNLLDRFTMYRLLLYYLIALILAAMSLSAVGALHFSAATIATSTIILVASCYAVNKALAAIFRTTTNTESSLITALILALIIAPMPNHTLINLTFLLAAAGLAMASKYILTINKRHIFNPAAIAVVLTALGPRQSASWWVGTTVMLPFVLVGGLLLIRKLRRGRMVSTFFTSTILATVLYNALAGNSVSTALHNTLLSSAMFFLGFVMLTEPLTTPPTAKKQTWYAILTGFLFPPQFHILRLYSTPELALVAGNIFSYIISPKTKLFPTLKRRQQLTPDIVDFAFNPGHKLAYKPGQYMEWTLAHHGTDSRGNRRYFTLASSPTEPDLRIGVKFRKDGSSYKRALLNMTRQTPLVAAQVAGDFVLPRDTKQKLVFIAGGIGITPYRSMVKYLLDNHETRTIALLYSARTSQDFAYREVFEQARQEIGLKIVYAVTNEAPAGRINAAMIKEEVPDYLERTFYISGTQAMVKAMRKLLIDLDVPSRQIKVDYFSGYA